MNIILKELYKNQILCYSCYSCASSCKSRSICHDWCGLHNFDERFLLQPSKDENNQPSEERDFQCLKEGNNQFKLKNCDGGDKTNSQLGSDMCNESSPYSSHIELDTAKMSNGSPLNEKLSGKNSKLNSSRIDSVETRNNSVDKDTEFAVNPTDPTDLTDLTDPASQIDQLVVIKTSDFSSSSTPVIEVDHKPMKSPPCDRKHGNKNNKNCYEINKSANKNKLLLDELASSPRTGGCSRVPSFQRVSSGVYGSQDMICLKDMQEGRSELPSTSTALQTFSTFPFNEG